MTHTYTRNREQTVCSLLRCGQHHTNVWNCVDSCSCYSSTMTSWSFWIVVCIINFWGHGPTYRTTNYVFLTSYWSFPLGNRNFLLTPGPFLSGVLFLKFLICDDLLEAIFLCFSLCLALPRSLSGLSVTLSSVSLLDEVLVSYGVSYHFEQKTQFLSWWVTCLSNPQFLKGGLSRCVKIKNYSTLLALMTFSPPRGPG